MADVWPFRPMLGCVETLQFYTEVNQTFTVEQRIDLRSAPRQIFEYSCRLESNNKLAVARAFAKQNSGGSIFLPVWPEETQYIGTLASVDSSIVMDTRYSDYRVGSLALVYQNWENYHYAEIFGVTDSLLTLSGPIGRSFINPSILPLREVITPTGYDFDRQATYQDATATFQCIDNIDLAEDYVGTYPTFNGLEVVTERPVLLEPISESIIRAAEHVDNGFGPIAIEPYRNYSDFGQTVVFYEPKGARLWNRRLWIHSLRGRQQTFYLPTFNNDLILRANIDAADTTIEVKPIAETGYYLNKSIMIWLKDGTRYFRDIITAADIGDNDAIEITPLGDDILITEVRMISFVTLNRSNSDQIQFNHRLRTGATVSIPTMEVPA